MRATIALAQLRLPSRPGSAARLLDLVAHTKPRVMLLAVFAAFLGLVIAPVMSIRFLGSLPLSGSPQELAPPARSICSTTPPSMP
jgi:hypothetical protein